jgi:excisionase family DNA binding protein
MDNEDRLLTPGEFAKHLKVDSKTVTRWAAAGKLRSIRTLGGHRRLYEADLRAIMNGEKPRAE